MKKAIALILIFSIVFSGLLPLKVHGETVSEENLEKIVLKVKELFSISNEYDNFVSRVNSYEDVVNYDLSWSDSKEILPSININVDSEGNIIAYNKYLNEVLEPESKLPNLSKDEALDNALKFLEKVDSKVYKEIELKDSSSPRTKWDRYYNFSFIRKINDVPYNSNSVNISVDMNTGDVSNIYINWERKTPFPTKDNIISLDNAKEVYKDEIGLKLVYKQKNRARIMDTGKIGDEYFLVYSTLGEPKGIDAITGKSISLSYYYPYMDEKQSREDSVTDSGGAPIITPEERQQIDKLKGLQTVEEAEKEGRTILDLDEAYKLRANNLYSSWDNQDEFFYSLSFIKKLEDKEQYADISLNAKTLELKSFSKSYEIDYEAKPAITKEEALTLAKDFIKKINPDKVDKIELIELYNRNEEDQQYYGFSFVRKVDDIYVETDSIYIGVDAVNKVVNSYNINWFKGEFPAKENIISLDKAYDSLFNKIGFNLNYHDIYRTDIIENQSNREIRLIYSVNQDKITNIDAYTGELLDYSGNLYKDKTTPNYNDIDNSYAKEKIITLGEYGVGFNSEKFSPKDTIKQKDFLYLLWQSLNPYRALPETDIDVVYKELTRQNLIKTGEENRERALTKEEAVKFVIRAMNYEKIAELTNIYADIFSDGENIDSNLKGYMTLAYGLKIINGDGSQDIKPKYELKREDAASIIYNYMFK
ncbi:MAG: hypothetical protein RIN55_00650 [Tissierellaceae bacterium]|nr:hypothetical protein [Tissierellaceae bacterium]